jgi:hypothetical protein
MKRIGLVCLGLALAANTAHAQLTMQMSNGWTFSFAGNVNAFLWYDRASEDGATLTPGGIVPAGATNNTRITTGLLPAFAVFDAKGKEGNTDLSVHFGFAPEVQCGNAVNDCFGAQIDMRQVFLTVGGTWGQLLVGRELGLMHRQNILTDQTLFGVGGTGNSGAPGAPGSQSGTTLGRIGFGYIYPQFRAQITYSTVAGRPYQFSVGVFESTQIYDGAGNNAYSNNRLPRVEAEFTFNQSGFKGWLNGGIQNVKTGPTGATESLTSWTGGGGLRYEAAAFSVTGSGYYGKGVGTTLFGSEGACYTVLGAPCVGGSDDARTSYGYIGQVTVTPPNSKVTIAGSYGSSILDASDTEEGTAADFKTENTLISGGIYFQATKSLKVVGEFNYTWTKEKVADPEKNSSITPTVGFMLFF